MSWKLPRRLRELPRAEGAFGLGPRLSAVLEAVPRGVVAADVGTDHALLPRALLARGAPRAIGIDASWEALARARARGDAPGLDLRRGDGLGSLAPGEATVVILAGLGGLTIGELLAAGPPSALGIERLILQPHAHEAHARHAAAAHGYRITHEAFVADGARFFVLIVADRSAAPVRLEEPDLVLGPILRRAGGPLFLAWLDAQERRLGRAPGEVAAARRALLDAARAAQGGQR